MTEEKNKDAVSEKDKRHLCFSLGEESFAIPLLLVKEVIALPFTTPIPGTPPYFKGVMNLRGQVISIIDLRVKLKMPKAGSGRETSVIIVDFLSLSMGVIVDSINSVLNVEPADLCPTPELETRNASISGVIKMEDKLILLLDLQAVLNPKDFELAEKAKTISPNNELKSGAKT